MSGPRLTTIASLGVALAVIASLGGCAGTGPGASGRFDPRDAIVDIDCNVADAELWVNERFVAEVGKLRGGIALSAGSHRIELRHEGYHTHYQELAVEERERLELTIELVEVLP